MYFSEVDLLLPVDSNFLMAPGPSSAWQKALQELRREKQIGAEYGSY